jgi:hypothetical protein
MNEFGFWQRWGLELDDEQFANAFLVLGVLATSPFMKDRFSSEKDLQKVLLATLKLSQEKDKLLPWRFPKRNQHAKIGNEKIFLFGLNPCQVANAWKDIVSGTAIAPRVQILSYPLTEGVRPWFRMLFEANPPVRAAHIVFDTAKVRPHLKWPLRLGFLPGNAAEESVQKARFLWPSNELTSTVRIDRENANCDVLLFTGSSSQLLKTLLETPVPQKTNLFIVRGTFEDDLTAMNQRLSAIAAESHASGFIFLNSPVTDEILGRAMNRFVENLSHNQPVDVAVSEAFKKSYPTDPAIFLSRDLATFQIEHVLEKIHTRLMSLPKEARPQIESDSFDRMGIPVDKDKDDLTIPENAAKKLKEYKGTLIFEHEDSGAWSIAKMAKAIDHAESQVIDEKQQQRFLQERIFIKKEGKFVEEHRAFQKGVPTLIRMRIGPPDEKWESLEKGFPEEKLPKDREEWRLTVVLTEPNHLKEPLRGTIKLSKSGPSTDCEFRIQPGEYSIFEGRITVLHRGRVLQTGVLKARVVANEREISIDDKISFADILHVRAHIGDLEGRRQFDLAFVSNHTDDHRPRLTAIAKNHAWIVDLKAFDKITLSINSKLSRVAKLVKEYSGGLDSKNNRVLFVELARLGRLLYSYIVTEQLQAPTNRPGLVSKEYIQVVSTRSDALVPLEFIYDCETPEKNATLCPSWRKALSEGTCRTGCKTNKRSYVCPLGFWGVSKVIERHAMTPELARDGKNLFLQSEPTRNRDTLALSGTAVVAASKRVTAVELKPVLTACRDRLGVMPQKAKDWKQWTDLVANYNPRVLLALPHTDGEGENASMEIGGAVIESIDITEAYIRKPGGDNYPLVALLGCDTTGTALEYGSHVASFRWNGASVVIGTIATVFGKHAAKVAAMLVRGLMSGNDQPERLGEVIRSIKRQALLQGMLMPLCIVAFGDADWKLKRRKN